MVCMIVVAAIYWAVFNERYIFTVSHIPFSCIWQQRIVHLFSFKPISMELFKKKLHFHNTRSLGTVLCVRLYLKQFLCLYTHTHAIRISHHVHMKYHSKKCRSFANPHLRMYVRDSVVFRTHSQQDVSTSMRTLTPFFIFVSLSLFLNIYVLCFLFHWPFLCHFRECNWIVCEFHRTRDSVIL